MQDRHEDDHREGDGGAEGSAREEERHSPEERGALAHRQADDGEALERRDAIPRLRTEQFRQPREGCAGTHGERDPERRLTHRNGYRERRWDTRAGTIDLSIPRVRDGSYLPSLIEPRRRAERALLAVVQEAYVLGVSTRRVEDLVEALGITTMSKNISNY